MKERVGSANEQLARKEIERLLSKRCMRCDYQWMLRPQRNGEMRKPLRCPKCGSPYWDRPRRKQKEKTEAMTKGKKAC